MIVFDSRNPRYRIPTGAVSAGTEIRFSVRPETYRFPLQGYLCVKFENTGKQIELKMTHECTEESCEVFTVSLITGEQADLVWYYFRFENEGGFFFYGCDPNKRSGKCYFSGNITPLPYQLTVYDKDYEAPDWFGQGVCYHIFPDRFYRTEIPDKKRFEDRDRLIHQEWNEMPIYLPDKDGKITNRDFFGGNLEGIRSKLDYLNDLGVTCIYLSPIFEAYSNHRYDTANYENIDPMLGTKEEFTRLCAEAREYGIRVILDGVFNHTGFDSIYFNGAGRYPTLGAYQSQSSIYSSWYSFFKWPDDYACWWGIRTLPHVNEEDPHYSGYIAEYKDSIVRRWLRAGASGWRLDVADELPDSFIEKINHAARQEKEDALIIGEVWEDASNKVSYGSRRKYLLGHSLDGVMNYPFRSAVIDYLKGGSSDEFRACMESLFENYPPYAIYSAMNILGTHDTSRILSVLDASYESIPQERTTRAAYRMNDSQRVHAMRLLKIGSLIQFTFIGCPCVYYGDEAGMEGLEDPLNRRGYCWGNEDANLGLWYKRLGKARKQLSPVRSGSLEFIDSVSEVVAYTRKTGDEEVIAVCNRSEKKNTLRIPGLYSELFDYMTEERIPCSIEISDKHYSIVELQPQRAYLLIISK